MNLTEIFRTAIANTFRSKLRTSLTVTAIFIGAFTLTLTSAVGTGVASYLEVQVAGFGAKDVLALTKTAGPAAAIGDGPAPYDPAGATAAGAPGSDSGASAGVLSEEDLVAIAGTSGVLDVNAVVTVMPRYIEHDRGGKFQLVVNEATALTTADLAAGQQLSDDGNENRTLLPSSYLETLGFTDAASAVGEKVTIGISDYTGVMHEVEATVTGVQNLTLLGVGARLNQSLTEELYALQTLGEPAGAATGYFTASAHFDPDAGSGQLETLKSDLANQGYTARTLADQIGIFQTILTGIIGVLNAFGIIALLAAGIGIINTLLMSVQERTREIGLMKAMGMGKGRIYALFSFEAIFIGLLGSIIGAAAAIGAGTIISNVLADTILADLQGLRILQFAPASVGTIILLVMLISFLAATLPARRASRQNPIDALRYE